MRKTVWIVLVTVLFINACGGKSDSDASSATSESGDDGNAKSLALVRAEPKVKEAFINEAGVLYVSVEDDGTSRDGYAGYLCEILREQHAKASRVKVMKVNSINDPNRDNAYGVQLGESSCE